MNWREEEAARTLTNFIQALPPDAKLLVWCGWAYPYKSYLEDRDGSDLQMMGYQFQQMSGIEPFVIDQVISVHPSPAAARMLEDLSPLLETMGGTAGFLKEEAPDEYKTLLQAGAGIDGFLLSIHNTLE